MAVEQSLKYSSRTTALGYLREVKKIQPEGTDDKGRPKRPFLAAKITIHNGKDHEGKFRYRFIDVTFGDNAAASAKAFVGTTPEDLKGRQFQMVIENLRSEPWIEPAKGKKPEKRGVNDRGIVVDLAEQELATTA